MLGAVGSVVVEHRVRLVSLQLQRGADTAQWVHCNVAVGMPTLNARAPVASFFAYRALEAPPGLGNVGHADHGLVQAAIAEHVRLLHQRGTQDMGPGPRGLVAVLDRLHRGALAGPADRADGELHLRSAGMGGGGGWGAFFVRKAADFRSKDAHDHSMPRTRTIIVCLGRARS